MHCRSVPVVDMPASSKDDPPFPLVKSRHKAPQCVVDILREDVEAELDAALLEDHEFLGEKKLTAYLCQLLRAGNPRLGKNESNRIKAQLSDIRWTIRHRRELIRMELILQSPRLVRSLKKTKSGWSGMVWVSATHLAKVELEDDFVLGLLTTEGHRRIRGLFQGKRPLRHFASIKQYERSRTLSETHFQYVQRTSNNKFCLTDIDGEKVEVDKAWLLENFPSEMVASIKEDASCLIPLGSSAGQHDASQSNSTGDNPAIVYRNGPQEQMCLPKSLASGLHYLGFKSESQCVAASGGAIFVEGQLSSFRKLVLGCFQGRRHKVYFRKPVTQDKTKYCPLRPDHIRPNPVVVCLSSKNRDGSRVNLNHSVTIVERYIFDANQDLALELCQENLDRVCSTVVDGATYCGVAWARELTINKLLMNGP